MTVRLSWADIEAAADKLAGRWFDTQVAEVHGVPRGGCVPAVMVAQRLGVPVVGAPGPGTLVVDDLVDSGATARRLPGTFGFDALYRKPHSPADAAPEAIEVDGWLAFPWERDGGHPTDAVTRLIELVGEDPSREGLIDTPRRVVKAWQEMTCGYSLDPVAILRSALFEEKGADQMVVAGPFAFTSLCEHHCLPFAGMAAVGYIPADGRITGLSKLPRSVLALAQRLQVQERLTSEIADALEEALTPQGVGVVVRAIHSCAEIRGVRVRTPFTTSDMRGCLRDNPESRSELLSLMGDIR